MRDSTRTTLLTGLILFGLCLGILPDGTASAQKVLAQQSDSTSDSKADKASSEKPAKAESADKEQIDWLDVPKLDPVPAPPLKKINASLRKGIEFLIIDQNKNGSWGSARNTKGLNIYAPVPGAHHAFRAGVTSLCLSALIELEPEHKDLGPVIDRAEAFLMENLPKLRRATPDAIYNVWGHAFSIQALVRMHGRKPDDAERQKKIVDLIKMQYDMLTRYESVDGGWGYYDFNVGTKKPTSSSISFVNGTVLIAFDEARKIGIQPPKKLVDRAIAATKRQQKKDFSYFYGEYLKTRPMYPINRPGGSLGRSQTCNLALRLWGESNITDEVLIAWQHRLYARNGWLDIGRKRPIPHESWFAVAGYFYYYGHYYAALTFDHFPAVRKPEFQSHMAHLMLDRQEKDGSWWDYPFYSYHQPYGTAFALMTLSRCRPADEKPAEETAEK